MLEWKPMKHELFGVPIDDITLNEAVKKMLKAVPGKALTVMYANPETVIRATRDMGFRRLLASADIVFPDGIGLRLLGRFAGAPVRERVAGLDLIHALCEQASIKGWSVFLLGGRNNVAENTSLVLKRLYPGLHIAGTRDGFDGLLGSEEDKALRESDIVFVGLGSPFQETWIDRFAHTLPNLRIALATGGAFDMLSGTTPRAPHVLRMLGLEWLWRFLLEPSRFKRITTSVVVFPYKIMMHFAKHLFIITLLCASPLSALAQTYGDSEVPLIYPRSLWESSASLAELLQWVPEDKDDTNGYGEEGGNGNVNSNANIPDYAPIERIVIHDTGCPVSSPRCNSDTVDAREVIQSIYRNHAAVRGWGDLGYHYIIDRKGNIYEGRYGGNGVRGAHVYDTKTCRNFNVGTVGISILGNYSRALVPEAAFQSLTRLVGWLSATNGIEPSEAVKTSMVWANQKKTGSSGCDLTYGSFSSVFVGPVVLGHGDIEAGNSDPGTLDLVRLRKDAQVTKEKYKGLVYREQGTPNLYTIEGGVLKKAENLSGTATLNNNQLALFPEENKTVLPDATLVKSRTRGEIYKLEGGKRHHITSAILFQRLGFSLGSVKVLSDRELLGYAKGDPIVFSDGTLLASQKTGKTYLVTSNGKKRHILSPQAFAQNKFQQKNVIKVSETDLESYTSDGVVGLPEGTLFSLSYKATAPNYVVMDGGKKLITSWELFDKWKFDRKKIRVISKKDFELYPDKGELLMPNGTLVRESGRQELYLVFGGKKHWIQTFAVFEQLKLKLTQAVSLTAGALAKYATGPALAAAVDWDSVKQGKAPTVTAAPIVSVTPTIPAPTPSPTPASVSPQAPIVAAPLTGQTIRIGLFSVGEDENVSVSANGEFSVFTSQKPEQHFSSGQIVVVNWKTEGKTRFVAKQPGTIFTIASYSLLNWNKSINFNAFRGALELAYSPVSKKLWMVNELAFEDYLMGIGEALNTDHVEYQKAFAIASRSYALFHLQNGGKYGTDEVFHLNSTSSDQVYKGYSWELYSPRLADAARATAGMVMKYNGKIARSVYSSDSGGVTKNACTYFGKEFCTSDYAYLSGGIKDPEGTVRRDASVLAQSHGVGMSATGARRLAELGKSYKEILAYYYKGISIE